MRSCVHLLLLAAGSFMYAQLSLTAILISTVSFCLETEFNCEPGSVGTAQLSNRI